MPNGITLAKAAILVAINRTMTVNRLNMAIESMRREWFFIMFLLIFQLEYLASALVGNGWVRLIKVYMIL